MIKVRHPRPKVLSDPYDDFTPDYLRGLLAVPDAELKWHHLRDFLGPHLPSGTYAETVYFLPIAMEMLKCNEDTTLDLVTPVVGFCAKNADRLRTNGLLDEVRVELRKIFQAWTSTFDVIHYDRDGCQAKGWGLRYFDHVRRSETVCQMLEDLHRFETQADLLDSFMVSLVKNSSPVAAAWFLELARSQDDVYHPPARPSLIEALNNRDLIEHKGLIVLESFHDSTPSPTYWRDVFAKLGI